jgi:hypothetical protein
MVRRHSTAFRRPDIQTFPELRSVVIVPTESGDPQRLCAVQPPADTKCC